MIGFICFNLGIFVFSDYFEFKLLDVFDRLKYSARAFVGDEEHICIKIEDPIVPNMTTVRLEIWTNDDYLVGLYRIGLTAGEQLTILQIIDGEEYHFDYAGPDYESSDEFESSNDSGNDQDTDDDVFNMNF